MPTDVPVSAYRRLVPEQTNTPKLPGLTLVLIDFTAAEFSLNLQHHLISELPEVGGLVGTWSRRAATQRLILAPRQVAPCSCFYDLN